MKRGFLKELERRNVLKVAVGYLVAAWLLAQIADLALGSFAAPVWTMRALLVGLAIGFPIALILSWSYEMTQRGVVREEEVDRTVKFSDNSGRRVDLILLIIVAIVIVFMGLERFVFSKRYDRSTEIRTDKPVVRADTGVSPPPTAAPGMSGPPVSVAVLPFTALSTGPDDAYFSDGFTGAIIDALNPLPELQVTARRSAFRFRDSGLPVDEIARRLGIAHVIEGSVHRAGERLQASARLVRVDGGQELWSEIYDGHTDDGLAVQTDIAAKAASALGIPLTQALRERMGAVGIHDSEALVAFQKGLEYYDRAQREPNRIGLLRLANTHFEVVWSRAPETVDAYLYHSELHRQVLVSAAAGILNGEITDADLDGAPAALTRDYERAVRFAPSPRQEGQARFGQALMLGDWRNLAALTEQAANAPGCGTLSSLHLVAVFPNLTEPVRGAFERELRCDPFNALSSVQAIATQLLLGHADLALANARRGLDRLDDPSVSAHLALSLAYLGRHDEAEAAARNRIRPEDELLATLGLLAAIRGDAGSSRRYEDEWLGRYGPSDREGLIGAAARGERPDANRLAARIDARPLGHIVLLQAIQACRCGAPFDLSATPAFAALLSESGLEWPPRAPFPLPLKTW